MPNALDMFRAQKEAADHVYARLADVAALLSELRGHVNAVTADASFRALVRDEAALVARTEALLIEVRRVREQEATRFWPAVWRRWLVAVALALAAVAAAAAGDAWVRTPCAAEVATIRARDEMANTIARRLMTMSPTERRQLDVLMKWTAPAAR